MRFYMKGLWDLVCRYKTVFSDVWKIRH
ncbi:hemolysin activation protein, partial [Escherichia coli]|nr:hemolysin activation protein [Escherichia coli]EES9252017.1 hemolysin activation protein [Escherichia coli]EEV4253338.1 hemolysin activation protein [Escherichia coli]EFK5546247.1 hemolysin activation protein [Escherichia coli]EGY1070921.1 hemolysin activation protein [Escherichia coli]